MQVTSAPDGPPVYVLGAGFSKAISDAMPLTDALGKAITERLRFKWPKGSENVSFEERLTLLSTPLPFLPGFENTARRAQAERLTAALGEVLDERNSKVASGQAPLWLLQLVSLWHAQKAVVITFNYDTLVERAVTSARPSMIRRSDWAPIGIHGWQVVYPAPAPVNVGTFGDADAPTLGSFQLLKLHGSLNWYWSAGESATVVRDASVRGFANEVADGMDVAGVRLLDRFLVPPVTSKDGYYGINLVHQLWRAAHEAVAAAPSLAILGYSMPPADRIAAELLRAFGPDRPVRLVNKEVGSVDEANTPLGRASEMGFLVEATWYDEQAVEGFVEDEINRASASLRFRASETWVPSSAPAVVTFRLGPTIHEAVLRDTDSGVVATGIDWYAAGNSVMPPTEFALNESPRGLGLSLGDFYTFDRVREVIADGSPFDFMVDKHEFRVVGAEVAAVGRWPVAHLHAVPMN